MESMPILQWVHFEKPLRDIIFERGYHTPLGPRIYFTAAPPAGKEAMKFDYRQPAN